MDKDANIRSEEVSAKQAVQSSIEHEIAPPPHLCSPYHKRACGVSFDFKASLLYPSLEVANWIERAWFEHTHGPVFPDFNGSSELLATAIA